MKAGRKYFLLIPLLVVFSGTMFGQVSKPTITEVKQDNDGTMKVSWSMRSEDGIDHYEIFRSTTGSTGQFSHIGDAPRGTFFFYDNYDLFKAMGKYFSYEIKTLRADKTVISQSDPVGASFNSTSSAAKRTWGSIKAMFR